MPGTEKTGDGVENLVQKDEPDPLGGRDSVVRILRHKGLPVEDDQRLREDLAIHVGRAQVNPCQETASSFRPPHSPRHFTSRKFTPRHPLSL